MTVPTDGFADRVDAGRRLARLLEPLRASRPVVVGMARGGVPVAHEVARILGAPLDVVVVRKLGHPDQPELGLGALGEEGVRVVNEPLVAWLAVSAEMIEDVARREAAELDRRVRADTGNMAPVEVTGRSVVAVTTGWPPASPPAPWWRWRVDAGAARVVLAVPVGSPEAVASLRSVADDVVCVTTTARFFGISEWYRDFTQVGDVEVAAPVGRADDGAGDVVIKYLGSKRRLVPVLGEMLERWCADGPRPLHRHDPGSPGVQTAGRPT